jgi:hypothetical protein
VHAPLGVHASVFVYLFEVLQRNRDNRDRHVAKVIGKLIGTNMIRIRDIRNYPRVLMAKYGKNPPHYVLEVFLEKSMRSSGFFKGWLEAHAKTPDLSNEYLRRLARVLPMEMLQQFPARDLGRNGDSVMQLALRHQRLAAASMKFSVILVIGCMVACAWRFTQG